MLKIECPHCGGIHMGKQITPQGFKVTEQGISYKKYATVCIHCGKPFGWERYADKTAASREKAKQRTLRQLSKRKKQSMYAVDMPEPKKGHMTDEGAKQLLAAIIGQAAIDGKNKKHKAEVKDFLQSEWGKTVCEGLRTAMKVCDNVDANISADRVLDAVENGKIDMQYLIYRGGYNVQEN